MIEREKNNYDKQFIELLREAGIRDQVSSFSPILGMIDTRIPYNITWNGKKYVTYCGGPMLKDGKIVLTEAWQILGIQNRKYAEEFSRDLDFVMDGAVNKGKLLIVPIVDNKYDSSDFIELTSGNTVKVKPLVKNLFKKIVTIKDKYDVSMPDEYRWKELYTTGRSTNPDFPNFYCPAYQASLLRQWFVDENEDTLKVYPYYVNLNNIQRGENGPELDPMIVSWRLPKTRIAGILNLCPLEGIWKKCTSSGPDGSVRIRANVSPEINSVLDYQYDPKRSSSTKLRRQMECEIREGKKLSNNSLDPNNIVFIIYLDNNGNKQVAHTYVD